MSNSKHFVAVPGPHWGHLRPHLHLVLNILAQHENLHCTILLAPSAAPRVESELRAPALNHLHSGSNASKSVIDRLQLIKCFDPEKHKAVEVELGTMHEEGRDFAVFLPLFLKDVLRGEKDLKDQENKFNALATSFIMYDMFHPFVPEATETVCKELDTKLLPIVAFCPLNASAGFHHFADEKNGGMLDKMNRLAKADIASGRNAVEAFATHGFASYGEVLPLPGLPTKYDYEWYPLLGTLPTAMMGDGCMLVGKAHEAVRDPRTVALVLPFAAEAEPEATRAIKAELGKPVLSVGLQFPDNVWNGVNPVVEANAEPAKVSEDDERVLAFLDRMKAKHGAKSVCYVSLGSLFYPILRQELLTYVLNSLHAAGIPFVFAQASAMAQAVPPGLTHGLVDHEDTCIVKFSPQWQVLNHEATGFFVSHCGSNSSAEAILAKVPIVAMPFAADQGEYTAMLTEKYKVGIDLKQVKLFKEGNEKFNKLYDGTVIVGTEEAIVKEMNETWKRIRGKEGEEMRVRMSELREILTKSWESGESKKAMKSFADAF